MTPILLLGIDFYCQAKFASKARLSGQIEISIGTLVVISLAALVTSEIRPAAHAAEGDEVEYTFDRPITQGEETNAGTVKFDKEGEFKLHCKIHGQTMSGVVVVKPARAN